MSRSVNLPLSRLRMLLWNRRKPLKPRTMQQTHLIWRSDMFTGGSRILARGGSHSSARVTRWVGVACGEEPPIFFAFFTLNCELWWILAMLFSQLALCDFLRSTTPIFMKQDTICPVSAPHFTVIFWEVKVKVQGQNRRTKNLQNVIARP